MYEKTINDQLKLLKDKDNIILASKDSINSLNIKLKEKDNLFKEYKNILRKKKKYVFYVRLLFLSVDVCSTHKFYFRYPIGWFVV